MPNVYSTMSRADIAAKPESKGFTPESSIPTPQSGEIFVGGYSPVDIQKKTQQKSTSQPDEIADQIFVGGTAPGVSKNKNVQGALSKQLTRPKDYNAESWKDVARGAYENAIPDLKEVFGGIGNAIKHPVDTAKGVGDLMYGAYSKAAGALGVEQDSQKKKADEASVNALIDMYKKRYGSLAGFKEAVETHPFSVAMDIATPFTLGETGLAKLGLSGAAKASGVVAKTLDPVQLAVSTAGKVTKIPEVMARGAQSILSGTPYEALSKAAKVYNGANSAQRAAFWKGMSSDTTSTDINMAARDALKKKQEAEIAAHKASKTGLNAEKSGHFNDFSDVDQALNGSYSRIKPYTNAMGQTVAQSPFPQAESAWKEIKNILDVHKADPDLQTLSEMDRLRDAVWAVGQKYGGDAEVMKVVGPVYDSLKNTIDAKAPGYLDILEKSKVNMNRINDITKSLGLTNKSAAGSSVGKMLKNQKSGKGRSLLDDLAEHDETFPYLLAGSSLSEAVPQDIWHGLIASGGLASMIKYPQYIPHIVGGIIASSPKVAGATNVLYGLGKNIVGKTTSYPVQKAVTSEALANKAPETTSEQDVSKIVENIKPLISHVESEGSGGYSAMGPEFSHKVGGVDLKDQAIGKYQVLRSNIPEWTSKYYGRELTPEEFARNPEAQEKVFEGAMGEAIQKYGNVQDAISWWHSGRPLKQAIKAGAKDVLGTTTEDYVRKVTGAAASGGRIERAAGGAVGKHEKLVNRLMVLAKKAKKGEEQATQALLAQPDEAVVKALSVAQEAI